MASPEPVVEDEKAEVATGKYSEFLGEDKSFLGWKKTALALVQKKPLKKKKLMKKLWKVYKQSKQYSELSLDQ